MRLWSLDLMYLDAKGLVALWREALLAKKVLEGRTKGYVNHPQLSRFRLAEKPLDAINAYLKYVHEEAERRGYQFNSKKFEEVRKVKPIKVTSGQLKYEFKHLLQKLMVRDEERYKQLRKIKEIKTHPLFQEIKGEVEEWERK